MKKIETLGYLLVFGGLIFAIKLIISGIEIAKTNHEIEKEVLKRYEKKVWEE